MSRPVRQRPVVPEPARARQTISFRQVAIRASTTTTATRGTRSSTSTTTTTTTRPVARNLNHELRNPTTTARGPSAARPTASQARPAPPPQTTRATPKQSVSVAPRRSARHQPPSPMPSRSPMQCRNCEFLSTASPPSSVYYCPICFVNAKKSCVTLQSTECGHVFCSPCLQMALERRPNCPICQRSITQNTFLEIFL